MIRNITLQYCWTYFWHLIKSANRIIKDQKNSIIIILFSYVILYYYNIIILYIKSYFTDNFINNKLKQNKLFIPYSFIIRIKIIMKKN